MEEGGVVVSEQKRWLEFARYWHKRTNLSLILPDETVHNPGGRKKEGKRKQTHAVEPLGEAMSRAFLILACINTIDDLI